MNEVDKKELRRLCDDIKNCGGLSKLMKGGLFSKWINMVSPAAILSLLDELEKVDSDRKACWSEFKALRRSADDNERYLREELDQFRKDALRYRWLREQEAEGIAVLNVADWERATACWALTYPDVELLDCAIDAAMAKDHAE